MSGSTSKDRNSSASVENGSSVNGDVTAKKAAPSFERESDYHLKMFKKIEWLKKRQKDLQVEINYEKMKNEELTDNSLEEITDLVDSMMYELYEKINNRHEEITIPRLQLAKVTSSIVMGNHEDLENINDHLEQIIQSITEDERDEFQKLIIELVELSSAIVAEYKEVHMLEEDNLNKSLQLDDTTSEMYHLIKNIHAREERIKKMKEIRIDTAATKKMKAKIDKKLKHIKIYNYILQLLVGCSGIPWAKNENLLELMIDSGKSLLQQLEDIDISESS